MKNYLIIILAVAGMLSACTTDNSTTVIRNVNGYTLLNDTLHTFSAVAFSDGKFLETGDESLAEQYPGAEVIDGEGKTMLPGLIDAHGHVMGLGMQELQVNLAGITSLEETLNEVEEYAEANPDLEWIQGRGWNQTLWENNEFPTAEDLDEVVDDRPVWLTRVDGHAAWGNTMAMEMAGISRDTPDPQGGKIIRDENGDATGVFVDAAENYVNSIIPPATEVENELALEKALEQMNRMGITSVHDAGIGVATWDRYKRFADQGKMTTRIYSMISGAGGTFDTLAANGPIPSYADDRLALRSVKLYSDGALGSRGAAMIEPYTDDPGNRGLLFYEQDEMDEMVMKTASAGYQTNVHAIGDRGNRVVLNAFANAREELGDQDLRHRIEHAQIVSLDDIPRFVDLELIASMQPTHATSDKNMAEDRVGPERIKGGYAWQKFLKQGTVIAAGSDFPVEHSNPFYGLYAAVTRMDQQGDPEGGWYPNERLNRTEALRAFTIDAAYAAFQEEILGTIESGKWADFILIEQDYFEIPAADIYDIDVAQTWVAGERVY